MSGISSRLDRLPFSRFHSKLLLMGGFGYTFDAMNSASLAFILPVLTATWHLTSAKTGLLASSTYAGYLLGALVTGTAGDLIGRKKIMMVALLNYSLASVLCTLTHDFTSFYLLRVLAGIGVGAESTIIAPYLSEFVGHRYRGRFVGALAGFISLGNLLAALLGYVLVGRDLGGYKLLLVVTALPSLMLVWWRRALPESPRWLESRDRTREAHIVVTAIESAVAREGHVLAPTTPADTAQLQSVRATLFGNLSVLWTGRLARLTAMCWFLWVSIAFSYYAFFTWIPSLLVQGGMSIAKSFGFSIAIYAAQIPGYLSAAFLNERLGRQAVIAGYMSLGAMSAVALAFAKTEGQIVLAGMSLSLFMNGTFGGLYAYTAEIFPTRVRATGMGTSSSVGRLGAIGAPILVGVVFPAYGFKGVFGMTTLVLLCGVAVALVFGVPTRGRSLEEIARLTGEN
jgi:MFS transporter, putative metabolite:H+ symporter